MMKWAGHVARVGDVPNTVQNVVADFRAYRPPVRLACRLQDNIKKDLKEVK
jgi:hypothetical protein